MSCLLCDFKSTFEKGVDAHRIRVHIGYACEKCETKFTSTTALNRHKLEHDKLECMNCKFVAPTKTKGLKIERRLCVLLEIIQKKFCEWLIMSTDFYLPLPYNNSIKILNSMHRASVSLFKKYNTNCKRHHSDRAAQHNMPSN